MSTPFRLLSPPASTSASRQPLGETSGLDRGALAVVLAALAAWGGAFIANSSLLLREHRAFLLFDDAMISMAYARNLATGLGPVWTPGNPPVEGFTNPLWTALMVPVQWLPLPLWHRPLVVQLLGLTLLGLVVWRVRALLREHFRRPGSDETGPSPPIHLAFWLPAALLTAFHYSLAYWSLLGMEVALAALWAILAVHFAFDIVHAGRDRHLPLFAVFAAAYLTRMDLAILILVVASWVFLQGGFRRRQRHSWIGGTILLVAAIGAYQVWRMMVFGDPLPNTYYLKLGGVPLDVRLGRGWAKMLLTLREYLLPVAVLAGACGWALWRPWTRADHEPRGAGNSTARLRRLRTALGYRLRDPAALPSLLLAAYAAYSVWVGGDAWELPEINIGLNRFLAFLVPLAAVLVNDLWNRLGGLVSAHRWPRWRALTTTAFTLLMLALVNGLLLSPRHGDNLDKLLLQDRAPIVEAAGSVYVEFHRFQRRLAPGAKVVTYWAGIPAYFSEYEMVDGLGYADPHIAHQPLPPRFDATTYRPGHPKTDPAYLLAQNPDAFFQFWGIHHLPVRWPRHHMRQRGYVQRRDHWLRSDSPYLLPGGLEP